MKRTTAVFAILALFLPVFITAFFLRSLDDNSLFSWSWVFAAVEGWQVYLFLVAGLVIAAFLSLWAVPDDYHIAFLAVISFAAIVPLWQEPEIIIDASRYFTQAKHLEIYGVPYFIEEWGRGIVAWTDMPLVPFLYGLIFKVFGETRIGIQVFTTALFSLTTVLTYLIGKRLWGRETGLSGALLLLGMPYLLTQVPLMLVDIPTMCFFTLAVFAFLEAMTRGGIVWISISVVSIVLAVLSKYSSWLLLSVLPVMLVVHCFEKSATTGRTHAQRGFLVLVASGLLSAAVLSTKTDVIWQQISLLRGYQIPGLERWGETFSSTFFFQVHPFISVLALVSIVAAIRRHDRKMLITTWLILVIILLDIKRIRYILPAFPMLALMAGYGLNTIRQDRRRLILYGTVGSSLVVVFFAYLPFAKSMSAENIKHAGAYLETLQSGKIEVVTLSQPAPLVNPAVSVPLLDLFTAKQICYRFDTSACPPADAVRKSSLRFTWLYRNPQYYTCSPDRDRSVPVVVISDARSLELPGSVHKKLEGYRLLQEFTANENVFQSTVGIRLYQR